jgi:phage terminase Nu1 subunit (DNA packaging protein)
MATQVEVAEHIDLSVRQVQRLIKNGIIPSAKGNGGYDLEACTKSYISYLRAMAKRADNSGDTEEDIDINRERALNLRVDTRLKELKEEQLRGELAPVALIGWTLNKVSAQVSSVLDSIPLKVKRRIPTLTSTQVDLIKREIVTAQNAAAKVTVDVDEYNNQLDNN